MWLHFNIQSPRIRHRKCRELWTFRTFPLSMKLFLVELPMLTPPLSNYRTQCKLCAYALSFAIHWWQCSNICLEFFHQGQPSGTFQFLFSLIIFHLKCVGNYASTIVGYETRANSTVIDVMLYVNGRLFGLQNKSFSFVCLFDEGCCLRKTWFDNQHFNRYSFLRFFHVT